MSLNAELRAFLDSGYHQIPAAAREIMERAARQLAESGQAERALTAGAKAPRFSLPSATGHMVSLEDLLAGGPAVLTFYRGAWCPYCSITLRALQRHHDQITARGATLVAISPQIPDESLSLSQKHQLAFDVLTDLGSEVAERYGLAFELPDDLAGLYEAAGFELQRVNGGHARTLPIPATYLIDTQGTISWAFVDTDYTVRAEPTDILAALDASPRWHERRYRPAAAAARVPAPGRRRAPPPSCGGKGYRRLPGIYQSAATRAAGPGMGDRHADRNRPR